MEANGLGIKMKATASMITVPATRQLTVEGITPINCKT
jgi:hypothetical protein